MFTPTQKKQLNYLSKMLAKEMRVGIGLVATYTVSCKECKAKQSTHCVEIAERFIHSHEGHSTWASNSGFVPGETFLKRGRK